MCPTFFSSRQFFIHTVRNTSCFKRFILPEIVAKLWTYLIILLLVENWRNLTHSTDGRKHKTTTKQLSWHYMFLTVFCGFIIFRSGIFFSFCYLFASILNTLHIVTRLCLYRAAIEMQVDWLINWLCELVRLPLAGHRDHTTAQSPADMTADGWRPTCTARQTPFPERADRMVEWDGHRKDSERT